MVNIYDKTNRIVITIKNNNGDIIITDIKGNVIEN